MPKTQAGPPNSVSLVSSAQTVPSAASEYRFQKPDLSLMKISSDEAVHNGCITDSSLPPATFPNIHKSFRSSLFSSCQVPSSSRTSNPATTECETPILTAFKALQCLFGAPELRTFRWPEREPSSAMSAVHSSVSSQGMFG